MPSDMGWEPGDADARRSLVALVDRLVPDDDAGPGAVRLGVVDYLDRTLEQEHAGFRQMYKTGLRGLNECALAVHHVAFAELDVARQDELLQRVEAMTFGPEMYDFFERVRIHVMEGMFGDPSWGGNRDGGGWTLMGYPGPRTVWSFEDQQLDAVPSSRAPIRIGRRG